MNQKKSVYQFVAKVLIIIMILQGMPLWELGNAYKWEFQPDKLQKILDTLSVSGPSEALAADPANYATWQRENPEVLDFDTVPYYAYPGNHFAGQGVIFDGHKGNLFVCESKCGAINMPNQRQIDIGPGEWADILFVVPGTSVRTMTRGFGVKYISMDDYNWVAFYDRGDNLLEVFTGDQGDNFDGTGHWFLGMIHEEGIGRVRVGSSGWAFETYDYEVIRPVSFLPEAVIRAAPVPGALGRSIRFDGTSSFHKDTARQITEYLWDFDDSDGTDFDYPDATGPAAEYAYGKFGDYTVTLKVLDNGSH